MDEYYDWMDVDTTTYIYIYIYIYIYTHTTIYTTMDDIVCVHGT
jgi:hypothetical protein